MDEASDRQNAIMGPAFAAAGDAAQAFAEKRPPVWTGR